MKIIRKLGSVKLWGYGLFWSWNIIFLAFMGLGFVPLILPELINSVQLGLIPVPFLLYGVSLTLIPVAAVILGLTALRRAPGQLLRLGYGVEGPVMLLLVIRLFAMRELTAVVTLLLVVAGVGMGALLWQILDRRLDMRGPVWAHARLVGLSCLLLIGLYAGVWLAFYAVPVMVEMFRLTFEFMRNIPHILGEIWRGLVNLRWRDIGMAVFWIPTMLLGPILLAYTATLLVALPVVAPILYAQAWWRGARGLAAGYGWARAAAVMAVILAACVGLFLLTSRQPQRQAFALLQTPPANAAEAQKLLNQQTVIREGLLNAYLAPYRYTSVVGEVYHISSMYESTLGLSPEAAAQVQQLYEGVARPLLYEPVKARPAGNRWDNRVFSEEPAEAAELYRQFFDRPINAGEHDTVVQAVRSTWSGDQAQAAWQAVDEREVRLTRQEVTLAEHGDWADIEVYEVYQNQTLTRQEVVYYFSLPESAVVTGLWLGNSADRAQRFAYRVAPRGAAQTVYRNEVRYNRDPALVEQIGPRQYRLRIFPVEPKTRRWDDNTRFSAGIKEGPSLHMWLTYRALAIGDAWPLPRLAERRNVYWDAASTRLVNGQPMTADEETWLPESAPAAAPVTPTAHRVDFPGGQSVVMRPAAVGDLVTPTGQVRLAVVLDRSRSMAAQAGDVKAALARLTRLADSGAEIDVYLTASKYRGEAPSVVKLAEAQADTIMYYGGQNAAELLGQFNELSAGQAYTAVLVLTDGSGYELEDGGIKVSAPAAPVWMVHLGSNLPLGYDDPTLEAIQASGGGVVGNIDEALTRLALGLKGEAFDLVDGYVWLSGIEAGPGQVITHASTDPFAALAARRVILAEMRRQRGQLDQVGTLDRLHVLAVGQSIVTPYSSMIVLVDEQQKKLLDQLENQADRFAREYEQVGETAQPPALTGVPEPEEWLLLGLAVLILAGYVYAKRRALSQPAKL